MDDQTNFWRAAHWLLQHEARGRDGVEALASATCRALHRFEESLAVLVGQRGARILVARGLRDAQARYPFLQTVWLPADVETFAAQLAQSVAGIDPAKACDGLAALLAAGMAALSDSVGRDLAAGQVRRMWPELPGELIGVEEAGLEGA